MLIYEPAGRINGRQALTHPYFDDLDRSTVPAVGEEYIGVPLDQLPPEIASVFAAAANRDANAENIDLQHMPIIPETVTLGAASYPKIVAASANEAVAANAAVAANPALTGGEPLGENHHVNMSVD